MKSLVFLIAALGLACGSTPKPPSEPPLSPSDPSSSESAEEPVEEAPRIEVLHEIELGEVALLQFMGERVPPGMTETYGVTEVWVEFAEPEARRLQFQPSGELHFSDWRFDILSPDGHHLLFLQDRYGPYHVVEANPYRLMDYLLGGEPAHRFGYSDPEGSAWIHESAQWIDSSTVRYRAGLTTLEEFEFRLP